MNLATLPFHTQLIGGALSVLVLLFLTLFLIPAVIQSFKLGRYAKRLEKADTRDLDALSNLFKGDRILGHLWEEYRDTLHEQKDLDASGNYQVTAIRQTVPAETYFSEQMLVHSPLRRSISPAFSRALALSARSPASSLVCKHSRFLKARRK